MKLHSVLEAVTERIRERSAPTRAAYLDRIARAAARERGPDRLGCANVAHAFAGIPPNDKFRVVAERAPNLAVVTSYNDMLSAHAPFVRFPDIIKDEARRHGATAQVAAGVPAMCDGVTQGTAGMELSLFSRDTIAMATAVGLTHDVFDAALMLGICDKIVPGLLIGALHFGHLPTVFVPGGPMPSGLSNSEKAKVRELAAQGLVGRKELLEAEEKAYHTQGTCTFYGTANSNQMLMEAMGLHVPGAAFVQPQTGLRDELTREAVRTALGLLKARRYTPVGRLVDERSIVNAMAALLATGGSTNHLIHWVAVARAAGIVIDWDDFDQLSAAVPLLARVYPNGSADVNAFQAAGGPGFVIRELLDAGLMHEDVLTVREGGLREWTRVPALQEGRLAWAEAGPSRDEAVVRPAAQPFSATGGLKLLDQFQSNLIIAESLQEVGCHHAIRQVLADKIHRGTWFVLTTIDGVHLAEAVARAKLHLRATRQQCKFASFGAKTMVVNALLRLPQRLAVAGFRMLRKVLGWLSPARQQASAQRAPTSSGAA